MAGQIRGDATVAAGLACCPVVHVLQHAPVASEQPTVSGADPTKSRHTITENGVSRALSRLIWAPWSVVLWSKLQGLAAGSVPMTPILQPHSPIRPPTAPQAGSDGLS